MSFVVIESDEEEADNRDSICGRDIRLEPPKSTNVWNSKTMVDVPLESRLLTSSIPTPCSIHRVIVTAVEGDTIWSVKSEEFKLIRKYSDIMKVSARPQDYFSAGDIVAVLINKAFLRGKVRPTAIDQRFQVMLMDNGAMRYISKDCIYGLRSKSLQLRPALATPSSLHHCKVRDEGMFNKLASCVLLQKEVDMLVYEDDRVDFLIRNELLESSFIRIGVMSGALRYTVIRDNPVKENETKQFEVLAKTPRTIILRELPNTLFSEVTHRDVQCTNSLWKDKLQSEEFSPYRGGEYCAVKIGDTWERGRVLNSDLFVGTHTLMLVDTGYTAMTKSVAELPAIYFDIPAQAIRCFVDEDSEWFQNLSAGDKIKGFVTKSENGLDFRPI